MIARLLLVLMLVLGALPATAMPAGCHGEAAMTMPMDHAPRHDHQPALTDHGCIGCAALPDWLAERVAVPPLVAATDPKPTTASFAIRAAGPPTLRPPRIG